MTITRSQLEKMLVARRGQWMKNVGFDYRTSNGKNADLNDPIGYAARAAGGSVTDPASVVDVDLSGFSDIDELLAHAELRLCENILGNYIPVDVSGLPMSQSADQFGKRVQAHIEWLRTVIKEQYPAQTSGYTVRTYAMTRVDGYSDDIAANEV